jgi:hypothetical protein
MVERDTVNILINVRFILRASQTIDTNSNISLGYSFSVTLSCMIKLNYAYSTSLSYLYTTILIVMY